MSKRKRRHPGRKPSERRAALEGLPPIPPGLDELRKARSVVDPARTYRMRMPDGSIFETTGTEMLASADAFVAMADAQLAGDLDGMRRAASRILEDGS
jgi:hypothetical protein